MCVLWIVGCKVPAYHSIISEDSHCQRIVFYALLSACSFISTKWNRKKLVFKWSVPNNEVYLNWNSCKIIIPHTCLHLLPTVKLVIEIMMATLDSKTFLAVFAILSWAQQCEWLTTGHSPLLKGYSCNDTVCRYPAGHQDSVMQK